MQTIWTIKTSVRNPRFPDRGGIAPWSFNELAKAFPGSVKGKSVFLFQGVEGDSELAKVKELISELNLRLQEDRAERCPEISVTLGRHYTAEELDAFDFFQIFPTLPIGEAVKDAGPNPVLDSNSDIVAEGAPFGALSPYWWIVGCDFAGRELLEHERFEGLELIEIQETPRKLWLLWSKVEMGKIENECYDNLGNKFGSDDALVNNPNGCLPLEGNFGTPQLIYRRENIRETDAALTQERFAPIQRLPCWPSLIVSKKVKKFLQGVRGVGFIPVSVK